MSARSSASASRPITGGALSYIDGMGAKEFVALAKSWQKKYGAQFKPPKLLIDMAAKGETFYGRFDPYAKGEAKRRREPSGSAMYVWPRFARMAATAQKPRRL